MNEHYSIYSDVYNELEKELDIKGTKIGQAAFDVLDREDIADIIADGQYFYFESYSGGNNCPNNVYAYLKRFIKRKFGYDYLYDAMKKSFRASPKIVNAAVELDSRFDFEFPDKEFEIWGNGDYAQCTVVDEKVINENEVEYTIAIEYPENYWQLEKFLLRGIDEYMHELTDGSDYSFDAIVEDGTPKYFYGSDDMYVYTATVTVFAIAP